MHAVGGFHFDEFFLAPSGHVGIAADHARAGAQLLIELGPKFGIAGNGEIERNDRGGAEVHVAYVIVNEGN